LKINIIMLTIKESEIKPIGNFKEILELLRKKTDMAIRKANGDKEYHDGLSKVIKLICGDLGLISVLEDGYITGDTWDRKECMQCLLYTHLIIIDLNQISHTYLNKITEWDTPVEQLQDLMDEKHKIYKGLIIT